MGSGSKHRLLRLDKCKTGRGRIEELSCPVILILGEQLVEVFLRSIAGDAVGSQVIISLKLLDCVNSLGSADAVRFQVKSECFVKCILKLATASIPGVSELVIPRPKTNNPIGIRRDGIHQIFAGNIPIVFDLCNRVVVGYRGPTVGGGIYIDGMSFTTRE